MNLIYLYITFFKIGMFTFGGGYASLPLIETYVIEQNGWLTQAEMVDVISISNMTPGPIAVNAATFVGTKTAGLPGSIAATAGVVTPSALLMLLLGYLLFSTNNNVSFLEKILVMIKPAVVGLIFIAAINMTLSSVFEGSAGLYDINVNTLELICFVIGLILYYKKFDLTKLIILGAGLGIILSLLGL